MKTDISFIYRKKAGRHRIKYLQKSKDIWFFEILQHILTQNGCQTVIQRLLESMLLKNPAFSFRVFSLLSLRKLIDVAELFHKLNFFLFVCNYCLSHLWCLALIHLRFPFSLNPSIGLDQGISFNSGRSLTFLRDFNQQSLPTASTSHTTGL